MYILYQKSCVKKFQLGDNKSKKNSKARVFQWFIELNPKRNQRQALGFGWQDFSTLSLDAREISASSGEQALTVTSC
jgi:hypothetical protein